MLQRVGPRFFDAGVYSSTLNVMQMRPVAVFASLEAGVHACTESGMATCPCRCNYL